MRVPRGHSAKSDGVYQQTSVVAWVGWGGRGATRCCTPCTVKCLDGSLDALQPGLVLLARENCQHIVTLQKTNVLAVAQTVLSVVVVGLIYLGSVRTYNGNNFFDIIGWEWVNPFPAGKSILGHRFLQLLEVDNPAVTCARWTRSSHRTPKERWCSQNHQPELQSGCDIAW